MIVTLKTILGLADAKKIAIGAFNVAELEGIQSVLGAAEELGQPVIIQFVPIHEEYIKMETLGPIMVMMADKAAVPVCVHLDHCSDFDTIKRALDMGFSSVMYDGSMLSFEENAANTKAAVEIASGYGASVEAEIGAMDSEDGAAADSCYTEPDEAEKFVKLTGIDALACSFGTVHGLYKAEPKLDFPRIKEIRDKIGIPIVMHGGSGVSDEDFKKCIANGVRKINYYTYRAKKGGEYVKKKCMETEGPVFFHDITCWAREVMTEDIGHAMEVFSGISGK
ncbi:class II fructose-bisphosphate aldolase [Muricomes intestini]|uniref:class II fructose-bisphosphate aldolase n=1 Tax=Muricomes intestini TaxID=1796634 RepID=UPI002FDB8488